MTSTELACAACGIELPANSKFCNECGKPIQWANTPAEFKQVTVLFADVVIRWILLAPYDVKSAAL
jgi:adenylate cyclase